MKVKALRRTTIHSASIAFATAALVTMLGGCSTTFTLDGQWKASDGSIKTYSSNGSCRGWVSVDIGGPQSCSFSSSKDSAGRYTLNVSQPPNERSLGIEDLGGGKIKAYDGSTVLWTLTKQ
jgi:hypothetical protein